MTKQRRRGVQAQFDAKYMRELRKITQEELADKADEEREECLVHIRKIESDCDPRFVLLDEAALSGDTKGRITSVETLGIISGDIVLKRHKDFTVVGTPEIQVYDETLTALQRLTVADLFPTVDKLLKKHFGT